MGQMVLANQFISGLRSDLKAKVVGTEGNLEQLLVKAWFEEAKKEELAAIKVTNPNKKPAESPSQTTLSKSVPQTTPTNAGTAKTDKSCYNCGMQGHIARSCPYPRQRKSDQEARGPRVSSLTGQETGEASVP